MARAAFPNDLRVAKTHTVRESALASREAPPRPPRTSVLIAWPYVIILVDLALAMTTAFTGNALSMPKCVRNFSALSTSVIVCASCAAGGAGVVCIIGHIQVCIIVHICRGALHNIAPGQSAVRKRRRGRRAWGRVARRTSACYTYTAMSEVSNFHAATSPAPTSCGKDEFRTYEQQGAPEVST